MIMDAFELLARWGRPQTPIIRPRQVRASPGSCSSADRCPDVLEAETSDNDGTAGSPENLTSGGPLHGHPPCRDTPPDPTNRSAPDAAAIS